MHTAHVVMSPFVFWLDWELESTECADFDWDGVCVTTQLCRNKDTHEVSHSLFVVWGPCPQLTVKHGSHLLTLTLRLTLPSSPVCLSLNIFVTVLKMSCMSRDPYKLATSDWNSLPVPFVLVRPNTSKCPRVLVELGSLNPWELPLASLRDMATLTCQTDQVRNFVVLTCSIPFYSIVCSCTIQSICVELAFINSS